MNDEKNIQDQFNILFDDITEELKDEKVEIEEKAEAVQAEAATEIEASFDELKDEVDDAKAELDDALETVEDAGAKADSIFDEIDMDAEEDRKAEARYHLDEEEDEEPEEEIPVKTEERKPRKSKAEASDNEKKENVRFLIFTAIVAILVVAVILFILFKRGFIFNSTPEESTPETSTTELITDTEDTEPTTDSSEETTETTEEEQPEKKVLENYENIFVVDGTDSLILRSLPSTDGEKIGLLAKFAAGNVLGTEGDWLKVVSGGLEGYVKAEFVKTGEEAEKLAVENAKQYVRANAEAGLNLRKDPSPEGEVVETVKNGAVMFYKGEEGDFYRVNYGNRSDGYVSKNFSTFDYYLEGAVPVD